MIIVGLNSHDDKNLTDVERNLIKRSKNVNYLQMAQRLKSEQKFWVSELYVAPHLRKLTWLNSTLLIMSSDFRNDGVYQQSILLSFTVHS